MDRTQKILWNPAEVEIRVQITVGAFIINNRIFNMQKTNENHRIHQKAYHHIKKHKKKYVRFVSFFIFLVIYSVIEDLIAVTLHGVEFDIIVLINVFTIALLFTGIAEITERIFKKEEPKLEKFIKKEEDFIEDEEKVIEKKIKRKKLI